MAPVNATCKAVGDEEFINHIKWLAESEENRKSTWERDHEVVRPKLFYEENGNGFKHVNAYMSLFGKVLLPEDYQPKVQVPGGYGNNMKDLAGMIGAYCGDRKRLAVSNMRGLNLPLALLKCKPEYLHILEKRVPEGIEHLYKEAGDDARVLLHQFVESPWIMDGVILDCLEIKTEQLKCMIMDALEMSNGQSLGAALTLNYALKHPERVIAHIFTNSRAALTG